MTEMTEEDVDIHLEGVDLPEVERGKGEDEQKASSLLRGELLFLYSLFNSAVSDLEYVVSDDQW
jgi:hypothetical protein